MNPAARNSDPITSHLSDREISESGQRLTRARLFAELVSQFEGHTSNEIAHKFGLCRYEAGKRLSDARGMNLVVNGDNKKCDVSGKLAMVWRTK